MGEVTFDPLGECGEITSVVELMFSDIAVMYPNPAVEYFTISADRDFDVVEVLDLSGRYVAATNTPGDVNILNIPVSHLSAGVYLVKITGSSFTATGKMMIQ